MTNIVYTKMYPQPPFDKKEILRYAGVRGDAPELAELVQACLQEIGNKLIYKVCFREFPIKYEKPYLNLDFMKTDSADLRKNLKGCSCIVLFAATVGIELDRLIAKYSRISPTKALLFQAIGAERIESLCDIFNSEITRQAEEAGRFTRPRFSPGYGDLPIEIQKEIFSVLDCPRKIGLSLNDSLLMSPSKSVTALIGIGSTECEDPSGCEICGREDCDYRRAE